MGTSSSSGHLGPLPKSDRRAELQRLSINALNTALPADRFLFRHEPLFDVGVDGSIELLFDSAHTNLRCQVQIKGTDSNHINDDGSISVSSIAPANLNHLLNGPSPVYVLYVAPRNELRFAWARDEAKRLNETNPTWRSQGSITIRFNTILTPDTVEQIHARVRQEAQLSRRIHDMLGRASSSENIITRIDPDTLAITDPDEVYNLLITSGSTFVSSGYAPEVEGLIKLLKPSAAREPRIQLIGAYAAFEMGRYLTCLSYLAEAQVPNEGLSADDQQFLICLRDACEFQTGRINIDDYSERLSSNVREAPDGVTFSYRLNDLRYRYLSEHDLSRRDQYLTDLNANVTAALASHDVAEAVKLQAYLMLLEIVGHEAVVGFFSQEIFHSRIRQAFGRERDFSSVLQKQAERWKLWERKVGLALEWAQKLGVPIRIGDALSIRTSIRVGHILNSIIWNMRLDTTSRLPHHMIQQAMEHMINAAMDDADEAMRIYAQADQLEGELRVKMHIADLLVLKGDELAGQTIAKEVLPIAQAMSYALLELRAKEHLSGQNALRRCEAEIGRNHSEDSDFTLADRTDAETIDVARETLKALELPEERLPILERDFFSVQDIARERIRWCRHIDLIQGLRHTLEDSSLYRTDPERFCLCQKHDHRSAIGHPDWHIVISAFKQTYCEGCPDRNPKQSVAI